MSPRGPGIPGQMWFVMCSELLCLPLMTWMFGRSFFMLARCILFSPCPAKGGRHGWRDNLKLVRARIKRWRDGDILGLWSEVCEEKLKRRSKPRKETSESLCATNVRRARRAMEDGQYKKAAQALTSSGLGSTEFTRSSHPNAGKAPPG